MALNPLYDINKLDPGKVSELASKARSRKSGEGMSEFEQARGQIRYEEEQHLESLLDRANPNYKFENEEYRMAASRADASRDPQYQNILNSQGAIAAANYAYNKEKGTLGEDKFDEVVTDFNPLAIDQQGGKQAQVAKQALSLPAEGNIVSTGLGFSREGVDVAAPPGTFAVVYENGAVEYRRLPASGRIPSTSEIKASGRAGEDVGSVGKEVLRTGKTLANPKSGADATAPDGQYVIEYADGTFEYRDLPKGGFIPSPSQLRQGGDSSGAMGVDTAGKSKEELQKEQGVFKESAAVDNSGLEYIGAKYTSASGATREAKPGNAFYQDPKTRTILERPDTGAENALESKSPSVLASRNDIPGMFEAVYGRKPNAQELKYWQSRTDKTGAAMIGAMQFAKQGGKSIGSPQPGQAGGDPIAAIDSALNAGQEADFATIASATTKVDLSKSAQLVDKLTKMLNEKPSTPSLKDEYEKELLRSGFNEDSASLAEAEKAIKQLDADFMSTLEGEEARQVSVSQIRRRQSTQEIAYNRIRRDLIVDRDYLANKVAGKQAIVNTMVQLTGQDIQNAQADYQSKFQNALGITNLIRGVEQDQLTALQRQQDNARANVQIMSGLLTSGNLKYTQLDSATKSQLKSMELQAGLPLGFTQFVSETVKDPDVQFLPAYTDINGVRIQPIATVNPKTGAYTIKNVNQGKVDLPAGSKGEPKLTDAEKEGKKFMDDTSGLVEKMIAGDYNWQQAWDVLRFRYPTASVETIDNALGLANRSKYNK